MLCQKEDIFKKVKTYDLCQVVNHYTHDELVECGSYTYQLSDKCCPFCDHKDCFKVKYIPEDNEQSFKCFSCDKGGDATDFVAAFHEIEPLEAARKLIRDAETYGFDEVAVEHRVKPARRSGVRPYKVNPSPEQVAIFNAAANWFKQCLQESPEDLSYQAKVRSHGSESLLNNHVGLCDGVLLAALESQGFTIQQAVESGLVMPFGNDYFPKGSFIYVHTDADGNACDFTQKQRPEDKPDDSTNGDSKKKAVLLYRLKNEHRLKKVLFYGEHTLSRGKESKTVLIVEGQNDLISCVEAGWQHAILATTGKPSQEQIRRLETEFPGWHVITLFDPDDAGDKDRMQLARSSIKHLTQYVLPGRDMDADDYLKHYECSINQLFDQCSEFDPQACVAELDKAETDLEPTTSVVVSVPVDASQYPSTDFGNADMFRALCGGDVKYVKEHQLPAFYENGFWIPYCESEPLEIARKVGDLKMAYAKALPENDDGQRRHKKELIRAASSCHNAHRINAFQKLAYKHREMIASIEDFDNDPYLLGVKNGVIDLKTGELAPASRELMITKQCSANYNPEATCPLWMATLNKALDDCDEAERQAVIRYIQQVFGMSLIGKTLERSLFFFYGRPGTGKSVVTNTVKNVLSKYAMILSPNSLMQSSYQSNDNKAPELVHLKGVRFALAQEADDGQRFNESTLKRITGDDDMSARDLNEKSITFKPQCTLFLVGNSRPSAAGSKAFWERLKVIRFDNQIPKAQMDGHLPEKLLRESDGILAWLIQGCLDYQQNGLIEPERVIKDSAAYRDDLDPIAQFLADNCVIGKEYFESNNDLYQVYQHWVGDTLGKNAGVLVLNRLKEKLYENGFGKDRKRIPRKGQNPVNVFTGLKLTDEAIERLESGFRMPGVF